ncbi:hypothetical protein DYB38_006085 [Aphanomyces astaci]|uniref:VWFA domain-containing protein n=1 Tax=Aphanomyces astaci TaxID=112090 RepID=A0A397DW89_APHAT|nr:hypothetical protein DYB38_006085 [Aphanomyces astaci]
MAFEWSNEEEKYVQPEIPGRDALIVLIDVRQSIFDASDDPSKTWFQTCIDMLVRYLKSKVIANDNSLLGVCFFGTKQVKNINSLEHVYEFQEIGYPSARRIKQLTDLVSPKFDFEGTFGSMATTDQVSLSNAFLKKQDTQTIWILTNGEDPSAGNADERTRIHEQFKNHLELHRTLNLFYMPPSSSTSFDLSTFYATMFTDAASPVPDDDYKKQAAFAIHTYEDMMEESLRKRYRKRRLATLRLSITKSVKLSVELYALRVRQTRPTPVNLDAETNLPLQSGTKWLCNHTGSFLSPQEIHTYLEYGGGHRVYLTKDDMVQIKRFDAAGIQLLAFEPTSVIRLHENVRAPYFLFPTDCWDEDEEEWMYQNAVVGSIESTDVVPKQTIFHKYCYDSAVASSKSKVILPSQLAPGSPVVVGSKRPMSEDEQQDINKRLKLTHADETGGVL